MRVGWNLNRRVPDNFCEYVAKEFESMPPLKRRHLADSLGFDRTGFFDTHPCNGERIRAARRVASPGLIRDETPAASLFENFPALSRQITYLHYGEDLGLPVEIALFVPVNETTWEEQITEGVVVQS
jgi:hypothetical protein